MRRSTAQEARIVTARVVEYLEVAETTLARMKDASRSTSSQYANGTIAYWDHVCSSLRWIIQQESISIDRERHNVNRTT